MDKKHASGLLPLCQRPGRSLLLPACVLAFLVLNIGLLYSFRGQRGSCGAATYRNAEDKPTLQGLVQTAAPIAEMYKRLLTYKTLTVDGKSFHVYDPARGPGGEAYWKMFTDTTWEPETYAAFKACIAPSTTVIDFGSWIGPTILWEAALGAKEVFSFEPDPLAYATLVLNMQLNGFRHVHMHHACIAATEGTLPLYFRDGNSVSSVFQIQDAGDGSQGHQSVIQVPCFPLNKVIQHYHLQNAELFIKIDIEGFEAQLVPALKSVFSRYRPSLHLSIHARLTKMTDQDFKNMVDALSVFPIAYKHIGGNSFSRIKSDQLYTAVRRDGRSNHEMVFTWPGRCGGLG